MKEEFRSGVSLLQLSKGGVFEQAGVKDAFAQFNDPSHQPKTKDDPKPTPGNVPIDRTQIPAAPTRP